MSYSNSGGGTLTLPSPTHVRHVDVTSAVRSLRRSLSRSPSKFKLKTQRASPHSPKTPLSPSPLSPRSPASYGQGHYGTPTHAPSPLAKPFPPSVKLSLRSASRAKYSPNAPVRLRTSPRSPLKRVSTSESNNRINSQAAPQMKLDYESKPPENIKPVDSKNTEKQNREKNTTNAEMNAPINQALARLEGKHDGAVTPNSTSSPLKRSDAIMNLDQASLGSPVAKRRSLHGSANFGHDSNVFDQSPVSSPQFDIHEDASTQEFDLSAQSIMGGNSSAYGGMPRRSSSLRKSTLQQRQEKSASWGKRQAVQELSSLSSEFSTPNAPKTRPRLSLDQFMPPMARDSPFTSQGALPNPSMHIFNLQPAQKQHPLSRTLTTSSSTSSMADESPTHFPVNFGENPRPKLDFSKSLPVGALRPMALQAIAREESGANTFSTPENYKSAKPNQAAFMSTGLISKVNYHPENAPRRNGKSIMPDTPCKKPFNGFNTMPAPVVAGSAIAKARHIRHSFGAPSTPFNPNGIQSQGVFGMNRNVFGNSFKSGGITRRGSFVSIDGDDAESPENLNDSQSASDYDLPPTPTKQALGSNGAIRGSANGLRSLQLSAFGSEMPKPPRSSSKLNLLTTSCDSDEDNAALDSKSHPVTLCNPISDPPLSLSSLSPSPSFQGPTLEVEAPLGHLTSPFLSPKSKSGNAKFSHVVPASPLDRIDFIEKRAPNTPHEDTLPHDASRLSISTRRTRQLKRHGSASGGNMLPPATPTTARDNPQINGGVTPVNGSAPEEVDEVLTSLFEKVEKIGGGEFSDVYRVTQPHNAPAPAQPFYFGASNSPLQSRSLPSPPPDRVFAVKKSRAAYVGQKDRQRKLQEVDVLKALGSSDHIIQLVDSWETNDHLYIQTEYCEEGNLASFLSTVGMKGRLDDFRIWKIMLELGQGLRHIHDSGYIHLDLKPANIFITFEGVIKIGDFGMATSLPAQHGIEGEGDREYIGPEILLGQYDKPADIFAFGLIMLEIGGNVLLPDNGPSWQRLRSGDMTDVPSLTWSSSSVVSRDATGIPVDDSDTSMDSYLSDDEMESDLASQHIQGRKRNYNPPKRSTSHDPANLFGSLRRGELSNSPAFMKDQYHCSALDGLVKWMITPRPEDRPTIHDILDSEGVRWVGQRRRAGATVFEGNWGPADDVLADDAEMIDV